MLRMRPKPPAGLPTINAGEPWSEMDLSDLKELPGTSFIVNGATPAKDSALVSTGAELRLVNGVTPSGKFDGEFARRSSTYAGTGTIRYAW
jgi:uncharacterized protein with beta-barrel porin domain